jgi:hypothetical protein
MRLRQQLPVDFIGVMSSASSVIVRMSSAMIALLSDGSLTACGRTDHRD